MEGSPDLLPRVLRAALGVALLVAAAWGLSSHRRRFPWRVVAFGVGLQVALAALLLGTRGGRAVFEGAAGLVAEMIARTAPGAELVFGDLARPDGPVGFVFAFAGTGLLVIVFFSALMAILYHLGVMQVLIWALARAMAFLMGVSGAEAMAMAANVFVGQTEAPLVVRPYLEGMTTSELNALMTGGFATIAGSVLAVYMGFLGPELGPHLLTASVLSAPAAFLIAKVMQPEVAVSATAGRVPLRIERTATNVVEAAASGTQDGLKLWLNVIAMLVAFVALVAFLDWPLEAFGRWLGRVSAFDGELSIARILGWVFAPVAWAIGVEGWHDSQLVGSLLGTKVALNEFVAFGALAEVAPELDPRSRRMAAYALCGFANLGSIGIQIGGIAALVPSRRADLARLAPRAMLGGALASWSTAAVAGAFLA